MAKDIYDKLKAAGDIFKQYWGIGLMIIASLSLTGNVYQAMDDEPIKPLPVEKKSETKKVIINKSDCVKCMKKLDEHINQFNKHIEEYNKTMRTYHK